MRIARKAPALIVSESLTKGSVHLIGASRTSIIHTKV
jgi:hypothetical protein